MIKGCRYIFVPAFFFALKCRPFSDHLKLSSGYTHIVTRKEIILDAFRRLEADMYGAILGDIIGSPFEFDRGDKTKNFELLQEAAVLQMIRS